MDAREPGDRRVAVLAALLAVGLTLVWGTDWAVMKWVLAEIPILTFRVVTAFGGGVLVLALCLLLGHRIRLPRSEWRPAALAALFNVTGWFLLTAIALTLLPAGRAAVLAYTMPLFAFLAGMALRGDRATLRGLAGLACGLAAVLLLAVRDAAHLGAAPLGVLAILGAAASWGIGTVLQKRDWSVPVLVLAGWQLLLGGLPILPVALMVDQAPFARLTPGGWAAMAYITGAAVLFGYFAWFSLVRLVSTSVASLAVLPVPLVGVMTGSLWLGEHLGWTEAGALLLVTVSLATVLPMPGLNRRRAP
ncbi:MAG: DMT family transporter [Alphaproteobacteria bacterium]